MKEMTFVSRSTVSIIEIACTWFSRPFSFPGLVFYFTFILDRLTSLPIFPSFRDFQFYDLDRFTLLLRYSEAERKDSSTCF